MIPYDDLVVALATWRAKKGLPVGQMPVAVAPPPPAVSAAPAAPAPSTGSGASGPKRAGPPGAPPAPSKPAPGSGRTAAPAPLPMAVDTLDVEEHIVDDDPQLETVDEFAHAFSNIQADGDEATSIGSAPGPARDSFGGQTDPSPLDPKGSIRPPNNRNDDW